VHRRPWAQAGLTLVEIAISFVILALGIFSLLGVFPFLFDLGENSQDIAVASSLAQQKLDELTSSNRPVGNPQAYDSPADLSRCTRTWWAETLPSAGTSPLSLQRVHVEVTWYLKNQKKSVCLTGLISPLH
jgi:Tfp pilus assembly protein PilV